MSSRASKAVWSGSGSYLPLHVACMFADPEAVKILLGRGAAPNVKDGKGNTPLFTLGRYACVDDEGRIRDTAAVLLDAGATVPRSGKDSTALIEAARYRHFEFKLQL